MSAPYPTSDQNMPPYPTQYPGASPYGGQAPPYPGGQAPPYPGGMPYQQPGYPPQQPPNVGFQPGFSNPGYNQPYYPPPQQSGGYDPSKPINPPYMDSTDPQYNGSGMGFDDKSIRAGFIRRVYSILSIQLLVTLGFIMLFVGVDSVKLFARNNPALLFIPMVGTIVLVCVISCFESARRTSPTNVILLGLFTIFESILVGVISSTYKTNIVLMAISLTTVIVLGLTVFAFQTKYDFTMCGGFLCIMLMVLCVGSLIGAFFFRSEFTNFLFACAGAVIFSMYIVYDTQMMMGGEHKYSISPEEYIFAALNLYMDIIQLFIYLLRILQYLNRD